MYGTCSMTHIPYMRRDNVGLAYVVRFPSFGGKSRDGLAGKWILFVACDLWMRGVKGVMIGDHSQGEQEC